MPRSKPPAWSAQELAILDDVFPREGVNGAADALPDRSWQAINVMASKRGLRSPVVGNAPEPKLKGERLEEAIRLREELGWSFARIGATFGVAEASACNAVLIALCPRKGFTPAQRDPNGRLTAEGLDRLRLALRKGMKGVDIQLRLGVSASCVAEQRRRYRADLKARGKAALPAPGNGDTYSGVKLTPADRREVERLLLEGYGAKRISEQTRASNTTVGRIRNRLIKRLARRGEALPGCDNKGCRRGPAKASRQFLIDEVRDAFRERLLDRQPVRRAAHELGISTAAAYRLRDAIGAEMAARGEELPAPILPGRTRVARPWLPPGKATTYRRLTHEYGIEEAKHLILAEVDAEKRAAAEARAAERARPKTFEEQLAAVAAGRGLVPALRLSRPDPAMTLGGVATGAL